MEVAGRRDAAFQLPQALHANSRCGRKRKRTVFTKEQVDLLVSVFEKHRYPGIDMREELARRIRVHESRVHVWFQNRRARYTMKNKARAISENRPWSQPCTPNTATPHHDDWSGRVQWLHRNPSLGDHFHGQTSLHNASYFQATLLPSPYMNFSPPPTTFSISIIHSQAVPNTGDTPSPGSPFSLPALPQRTVPPLLYGHPLQRFQQDASLPQLTEEDLAILQLPAGSDQT